MSFTFGEIVAFAGLLGAMIAYVLRAETVIARNSTKIDALEKHFFQMHTDLADRQTRFESAIQEDFKDLKESIVRLFDKIDEIRKT